MQIDSLELDDAGTYHVIVKNSNASLQNVYLESEDIQLTVEPCMDITFFEHSLSSKCYGASISFDATSVTGGTAPYVFTIIDENNAQTELHGDNDKLLSGTYELLVEDNAACRKTLQKTLLIEAKENCDEHVITPNGDGIQDDIYFSQEGEGIVYNQFGQEIKVIALPAHWDAKDENENVIPPGKYVIVINGKDAISLKVAW